MMEHTNRVIVLIDMDCFYCQVEENLDPRLKGLPIAVVQYNAWRGGGIIAVNYPARDKGVTRHMRGEDAKAKCPEIQLVRVPEVRGKADLTKYREAGKRVAEVLQTFTTLLERASVDEAYLDITQEVNRKIEAECKQIPVDKMRNTHIVGQETSDFLINSYSDREYCESNYKLAVGGLIAEEIRAAVFQKTGYKCSAGIAHNKPLAKLVCGLHKPNQQTILPHDSVSILYKDLPIKKMRSMGGKFGETVSQVLKIEKMSELVKFSLRDLTQHFDEKTANWLYNIARGIDVDPVTIRLISKSIGCCKKFPGRTSLILQEDVDHWMGELATEIAERLEKDVEENARRAKNITVSFAQKDVSRTRTQALNSYDMSRIKQIGLDVLKRYCLKPDGKYNITFLGLSVGNFETTKNVPNIYSFFKNNQKADSINLGAKDEQELNENWLEDKTEDINQSNDLTNQEVDGSNSSIYSASTVDLNEDHDKLTFYEDAVTNKDASPEPPVENNIINQAPNSPESNSHNSFFKNYFKMESERKYDTSKMFQTEEQVDSNDGLDEDAIEQEDLEVEYALTKPCPQCNQRILVDQFQSHLDAHLEESLCMNDDSKSPILSKAKQSNNEMYNNNSTQLETSTFVTEKLEETCQECGKTIPLSEMVSHTDYHYAIKMVKEESHLYKTPQPSNNLKTDKTSKKKNLKRKLTKDNSIKTFFKTEQLNDVNSSICPTCNKRVKLEEFESHADYHAAKKLHLELNSSKNEQSSVKGIAAFFK
ncbi:DNA polymerase eta [Aethina tumida]|uniref:DNA polymerase eta n=1 Tax=Aethina tumida TaxID=116153 RepID=UPI0021486E11|nr:DNA polymerase eta [Aethina tumida]